MTSDHTATADVPAGVIPYLAGESRKLEKCTIRRLRMTPLVLDVRFPDLLERRRRLFTHCENRETEYGHRVSVQRKTRPSQQFRQGKTFDTEFDVLLLAQNCCMLVSTLGAEQNKQGPGLLLDSAYPLAKRPFLQSQALVTLVNSMANRNGWLSIAVDAMGYTRNTQRFRRDCKRQPVDHAYHEMREQERHLHQIRIVFCEKRSEREVLVASFNRYSEVTMSHGSAEKAFSDFIMPAVRGAVSHAQTYAVERAGKPAMQEALHLVFPDDLFIHNEDMRALCQAVREADGLSVTTVHLNPYLQAQVLDFFTGAAVQMLIMDQRTVSLIPRSDACNGSLERIAQTILRFFGDADVRRERLAGG